MYNEQLIRVSKEMKALLDKTQAEWEKKGVKITRTEASRIVARRAESTKEKRDADLTFDIRM